jgi:hypothetical protein
MAMPIIDPESIFAKSESDRERLDALGITEEERAKFYT